MVTASFLTRAKLHLRGQTGTAPHEIPLLASKLLLPLHLLSRVTCRPSLAYGFLKLQNSALSLHLLWSLTRAYPTFFSGLYRALPIRCVKGLSSGKPRRNQEPTEWQKLTRSRGCDRLIASILFF